MKLSCRLNDQWVDLSKQASVTTSSASSASEQNNFCLNSGMKVVDKLHCRCWFIAIALTNNALNAN